MMTWPNFKAVILAGFLAGANISHYCGRELGVPCSQSQGFQVEAVRGRAVTGDSDLGGCLHDER
jgi:hypothetical protein